MFRRAGLVPVFGALLAVMPIGNLTAQAGSTDLEPPPAIWRASFGSVPTLRTEVGTPLVESAPEAASRTPRIPTFGFPQDPQLPCPDCKLEKNFWRGFGEVMIVQLVPWSVNYFARDAEWARIGPGSWLRNLENPWVWDNNNFQTNQFGHPYHGAMYFMSGRSNGYGFVQSMGWAAGGSLMWEIMGEVWAPAPNDLINTSLGGTVLGEMLTKLSHLTLDNTATGAERVWREIGGALLNPAQGLNRLLDGKSGKVAANPADWRPSKVQASLDVGYRGSEGDNTRTGEHGEADVSYAQFQAYYGDTIEDLAKAPFSTFHVNVEIGGKQFDGSRSLAQLNARGNLGGRTLSESDNARHQLGFTMFYQYINSPGVEFGGVGFDGGIVTQLGDPERFHWNMEGMLTAMPIAGIQSDYFTTEQGRDYDYGPGFGPRLRVAGILEGVAMVQAMYRYLWTPVLSGTDGNHYQQTASLEARAYVLGRFGVGGSLSWYKRQSNYYERGNQTADGTQVRLFASLAIPRWGSQ